jgi:hypothetical protein
MNRRTPDLVDAVLSLIEGQPATEVHACGVMLVSIALSKMRAEDREHLLDGLEWRVAENIEMFDHNARWTH